jgi:hypothetical protein
MPLNALDIQFKLANAKSHPTSGCLFQQHKRNFAYVDYETTLKFQVFRSCSSKVALKVWIALQKHLCQEQLLTENKRGIYKLNCHDCIESHIEQTGLSLKARRVQHTRYL